MRQIHVKERKKEKQHLATCGCTSQAGDPQSLGAGESWLSLLKQKPMELTVLRCLVSSKSNAKVSNVLYIMCVGCFLTEYVLPKDNVC